jgi:hypothetical protein
MNRSEIALQLTLAAHGEDSSIARGGASPKSTADAVGQLCAEVLYKMAHAIEDTEKVRQRVAV